MHLCYVPLPYLGINSHCMLPSEALFSASTDFPHKQSALLLLRPVTH